MAFAHKVVRCTISGTAFSGAEIWSTGFYMGATGADAAVPSLAGANMVKTAWATFFGTAGTGISSRWSTTQVKLARLQTDGHVELDTVVYADYPTPTAGGASTTAMPPQCALVATLTTAIPRGLASKGRMYLPGVNFSVGTDGRILTTSTDVTAANLKTFFDTVNASIDKPGTVINASKGRTPPLTGGGVNAVVTGLKIGNVYDTQRRRRNDLVETYVSKVLA